MTAVNDRGLIEDVYHRHFVALGFSSLAPREELTDDMRIGYLVALCDADPNIPTEWTTAQEIEFAREVIAFHK